MKIRLHLRSMVFAIATLAVTATSLSGCIIVPARGYYAGPPPVVYHGWGYGRPY